MNLKIRKPRIINIGNEKGGVGKTSIIRLLPTELASQGFKCLIIDMDPQSNTTKSLFVTRELFHPNEEFIVFDKTLMKGISDGNLKELIINVMPNLDFIPSAIDLSSFSKFLSKSFGLVDIGDSNYYEVTEKQYSYFKKLVDDIKEGYDFIFFDTPPTMSDITQAVSYTSDYILIAFQTQSDSLDGAVSFLNQTLLPLSENMNTNFEIIGILPNQMTKGNIDSTVLDDAKLIFGNDNVFENLIPFSKAIQNIPRKGITKEGYWNSKLFSSTIEPIANEFIERINIIEGE